MSTKKSATKKTAPEPKAKPVSKKGFIMKSPAKAEPKPAAKPKRKPTKPGLGARKGPEFERTVCKLLSNWLSDGKSQDLLWRSAASGARSTTRAKATSIGIADSAGDISAISSEARVFTSTFCIECKSYNDLLIQQLHYGKLQWESTRIGGWWKQATRDASSVNKLPLLIVKGNGTDILVVMQEPVYNVWLGHVSDSTEDFRAPVAEFPALRICVMRLETFFRLRSADMESFTCRIKPKAARRFLT